MASALYDTGRDAILNGGVNWTADTIKVALLGSGYTANMATDQFFSAVSASVIGTPMALANKSSAAGVANADPVTSASIATGSTITQIVIYKDTGNPATSQLIAREDVPSATPTNGGTVTLSWDSGVNKIFKL
jgi:hypothetical protein